MHMNNVDKKALRWKFKPIQTCLIFFGFCDHRFSPYADKIQNYFIGCGNLMLQGSSTSKNMPH